MIPFIPLLIFGGAALWIFTDYDSWGQVAIGTGVGLFVLQLVLLAAVAGVVLKSNKDPFDRLDRLKATRTRRR